MKEKRLTTKKMVIILSTVLITVLSLLFIFIKLNKQNTNFNNDSEEINYIQESDQTIIKEEEEKNEQVIEDYYDVTFYDEDGKVLFNKVYKYGDIPSCDEKIPNKTIEGITYIFKSWSPLFHEVEENQTYVATYKAVSLNNNTTLEPVIISSSSTKTYVPSPTDAIITYRDSLGNTKTLNLPKNTTINFSAGEHGLYNSVPSPITLSSKQELDITTTSYDPDSIEVNYIFKGFSYSGNTFTAMYEKASNIINYEIKRSNDVIIKNNVAYVELDYIESTGTQYINTGVNIPDDCVMDIDMQFTASNITNLIGTVGPGTTNYRADFGILNGKWFCYMGNDYFGNTENANSNRHQFKMDYTNKVFSIDGTTKKSFSSVYGTRDPYLLFARQDTSSINPYANCKLYEWKISQSSSTKYDFVPVERMSDNVLGMLDLVNGGFYVNSGTGVFYSNKTNIPTDLSAGKIYASVSGSSIALTAVPNEGYSFVCWNDGTISPNKNINVGDTDTHSAIFKAN